MGDKPLFLKGADLYLMLKEQQSNPNKAHSRPPGVPLKHFPSMAKSSLQEASYPSSKFVLSAGSVLFRTDRTTHRLQLCTLQNTRAKSPANCWILPKGRKDQFESMEVTAVRETFEETGYPCELYPVTLQTRAPAPGVHLSPYAVIEAKESMEPFYMTVRTLKDGSVKTIWWYLTWLKSNSAERVEGVAMANEEGYVSEFMDVPVAVEIYKGTKFEEIVVKAVELVTNTLQIESSE
ncbi:hypothetical protein NMY22_g4082 [Coprinellus aureogranulatus]|nr:hypothetical protein NMY22_g4082 [Coprinellus aureogranulatus]